MSLDQNLFTLSIAPNKDDANVVDLVDPTGTAHYRKQRVPGPVYKMEMYDPMSASLLITATSPNATSKHKTLELCNPTTIVELKYIGTLTFKWGFKWEEHEFEWKREECYMIRKPDPPVIVAVTKVSQARLKTSTVQILDYNLNRFDIEDRKGLEIVLLTALLTFQDLNEAYHAPRDESGPPSANPTPPGGVTRQASDTPPMPPPRPAPKTGVDRIVEMQGARGEYNEIVVEEEGKVNDYAQYCSNLLLDDAMLFVTLYSASADQVPKVLQVVEQTKRIWHKAGLEAHHELHQYVRYDTPTQSAGQRGPRRINLDDADKHKYAPPQDLTVHLSKIAMPELQPKAGPGGDARERDGGGRRGAEGRAKRPDERERERDGGRRRDEKKVPPPPDAKLSRQHLTPPASRARARPKQSPSPPQAAPRSRTVSSPAVDSLRSPPAPQQPPLDAKAPSAARPGPSTVAAGLFDMWHRRMPS